MSFVKHQIEMPKSSRNMHRFKVCSKCSQEKPPEGGIEMSATRWICAACWTHRATRRPSK